MLESREVKWFYRGNLPSDVSRWFNGAGIHDPNHETRIDHYLWTNKSEDLVIKLRSERLEIKWRKNHTRLEIPKISAMARVRRVAKVRTHTIRRA